VGVSVSGDRQYGEVIDVLVSENRDLAATRRFFLRALEHGPRPTEVTTDRARPPRE
jgi:IS6 family transposase